MMETVGKRLYKARLERGLSVDEAAHATRMRPDKILALEKDDYGRFGNNVYAKGFLLIYSRLLKVDASEEVRFLETPHDISVRDYQYLSNVAEPVAERPPSRISKRLTNRQPTRPSILPLLVLVFGILGFILFFYIRNNFLRISPELTPPPAPALQPPAPLEPPPANPPAPAAPALTPPAALPIESQVPVATPTAVNGLDGQPVEVRRAEPVQPGTTVPAGAPLGQSEITISAKKKTMVKIYKDDPRSRPIFEDYLYPKTVPLSFKGSRIFVTTREPANLEVKKDGVAVPFESGQPIQ